MTISSSSSEPTADTRAAPSKDNLKGEGEGREKRRRMAEGGKEKSEREERKEGKNNTKKKRIEERKRIVKKKKVCFTTGPYKSSPLVG